MLRSCVIGLVRAGPRARTLATTTSSDLVVLRGLIFHGHHGVYSEERRLGQKFQVDLSLETCLRAAGRSDDLKDTINYAQVYSDVFAIVTGPPAQLLETVAERIATKILASQPRVTGVQVGIAKPHVAVGGVLESLGVSIHRTRQE